MQLYFLRHGAADWPDWDPAQDHLRPLTREGVRKIKAEAKAMAAWGVTFDAVLSSPYTRAWQTADIVAETLGLEAVEEPRLAPGFNFDRLGEIVRQRPAAAALLLVGHEPTLSLTISQLIGGGRLVMKKGALARVDVITPEPLSGQLIWLVSPRLTAGRS